MVDEETADEDGEQFECDECPVAQALADLDPFNARVWSIYKQVVTRLSADLHAGGVVLQAVTRDLDPDDFAEIWRRLTLLYNTLNPPPPKET